MNPAIIHIISFATLFIIGELLARVIVFRTLNNRLGSKTEEGNARTKLNARAQLKGHLERLMLTIGLICGVQQVLIVFGTLKIGTWFRPMQKNLEKVDHDFFLIGNFLTVIVSLLYYLLYPYFFNCIQSYLDCVR
jgi:hypothetical protein